MKTTGTPEVLIADLAARKELSRAERAKLPYGRKLEIVEKLFNELEPFRRARAENNRRRLKRAQVARPDSKITQPVVWTLCG